MYVKCPSASGQMQARVRYIFNLGKTQNLWENPLENVIHMNWHTRMFLLYFLNLKQNSQNMLCSVQKFKCEVTRLHILYRCFRQKSHMAFYTRSWRQRHTLIGVNFFHSLKKVLGNISGGTVPILRPFEGFFCGDTPPSRTHSGVPPNAWKSQETIKNTWHKSWYQQTHSRP